MYRIYKVVYTPSEKVIYIGCTKNSLQTRFRDHCCKTSSAIYEIIQEYGRENFSIELIEILEDKQLAFAKEQFWTDFYREKTSGAIYNKRNGWKWNEDYKNLFSSLGTGKYIRTPEIRKKISDKAKERYANSEYEHPNKGKHLSEKQKKKQSESMKAYYKEHPDCHPMKDKHLSKETKQMLSDKAKERLKDKTKHPLYGKHHSEETKIKISKANKGRHATEEARMKMSFAHKGKPVPALVGKMAGAKNPKAHKVMCINTGEIFGCIKDAAEKYNVCGSAIINAIKRGHHSGLNEKGEKLSWKYL